MTTSEPKNQPKQPNERTAMSYFDKPVQVDPTKAANTIEPIPPGDYKMVVDRAEESKSKAGNAMLKLQFMVIDGQYANRKVFQCINLEHSNPEVVAIGTRQLHALLMLTGLEQITDATNLTGRVLHAKVKIRKREDTGELTNEVVLSVRKGQAPGSGETMPTSPTAPKATDEPAW